MLDPVRGVIDVPGLGLSDDELARVDPFFRGSQGAVFVTGPTGSGKTSTLYAALGAINTREKSIVSVEDPVEYRLRGVKQVQIHPKAGLTFPTALRSILRIDPDVIFIGEVRDAETARIAAEASITGHLVLSTLHTTSAAATPMRLVDMGLEPYLVASALSCVVAQRLVRKLCEQCARPTGARDAVRLLHDLGADDALIEQAALRTPSAAPRAGTPDTRVGTRSTRSCPSAKASRGWSSSGRRSPTSNGWRPTRAWTPCGPPGSNGSSVAISASTNCCASSPEGSRAPTFRPRWTPALPAVRLWL
jgi:type II secretory ATPase GspE/PulE/Tfp pilus assembly ATPase PilB-like protein